MAENSSSADMASTKPVENDDELNELLDSALEDFDKPAGITSGKAAANKTDNAGDDATSDDALWNEEFLLEAQKQFEQNFKALLGGAGGDSENVDAEAFSEQFQKMAHEARNFFAQESTDPEFSNTIAETLKCLTENSENLQSELEKIGDDELSSLFGGLGLGGPEANTDFLPFMQSTLRSFLSKDLLYPAIKEITEKFPGWLESKKSCLPDKEYENYATQLSILTKICDEYEKETPADTEPTKKERFAKLLALMEELQKAGKLPQEIVEETPFTFDEQGSPIPISGFDPSQCSIM